VDDAIEVLLEHAVRRGTIGRKEKPLFVSLANSLRHYSIADVRRIIGDMLRDGELNQAGAQRMIELMEAMSGYLDNDGSRRLS